MKNPAWRIIAAVSAALTLLVAASGQAEDSFPPCWRGNPGTTYENWSFAGPNNPAAPDLFTNVNGTPLASFVVGAFGTGWKSVTVGGRTGAWDLGQAGSASLAVPNFGGAPAWKNVQVQVTYFDAPGFYLPPVVSIAGASLVSSQVINNQVAAPGNWKTYQTVWSLQPSPASETIALAGDSIKGLLIDQIVVDTRCATPPAITCPANITVNAAQGVCTSNVTFIVTTMDNCGSTSVVSVPASGSAFPVGTTTVISTANDGNGDTNQCSFTVTVVDNQPPVLSCPGNITVNAAAGGCTSNVTFSVTATDNCGSASVMSVPASGFAFPVGTTTVTNTASDGHGNTSQCTFTVTVVDNQPPAITCPGNITVNAASGACTSNVTFTVSATDNCGSASVVSVPASGFAFPVGTTTVTNTASDGHGNTSQCSFTVTVVDDQSPAITCPANITVNAAAGGCTSNVTFSVTATDNCGSASVVSVPASGFAFPVGTTTVTNTANDGHGNTSQCTFTVTVVDNQPPTITCPANITVNTAPGLCTSNVTFTVTATDNCGSASVVSLPASGFAFPVGTTTVTNTANDGNGNTIQCSFTVTVQDHEPPTITVCPPDQTFVGCHAAIPDLTGEVVATDNCSTSFTVSQEPPAGANIVMQTTVVTFTVQDAAGNSATCNTTIALEPPTLSIAGMAQTVTLTWPNGGTLLEADALTGPWSPVVDAASPYAVPQPLEQVKFYRLKCD